MLLIDAHVFPPGKPSTQNLPNHVFQYKMNYNCNSKFFPHMHMYIHEITFGSNWHADATVIH